MKYLGEYYHTEIGATIALKLWQRKTYKEIEKRGDKILSDTSHVCKRFVWTKSKESNGLTFSSETKIKKWFIFRGIYTQSLYDDIKNMKPFDYEAELKKLIEE
jgi:hypothetical protein